MQGRIARTTVGVIGALLLVALLVPGGPLSTAKQTESTMQEPAANETDFRMVVIFRNDDLEPAHRDDLRRDVHQTFVDEGVPVTSSVIPTTDGEPITRNGTFCEELRENRRSHPELIEYAMHGYLHEEGPTQFTEGDAGGGSGTLSEFGGLPYEEQRERISDGARILERCLGERPRTFVPPYGTYDNATVRALAAENITTISGGGWFTQAYYNETSVFETGEVIHVPRGEGFVQNWESVSFFDQQYLRTNFDRAYERGGVYVHVLHYWTFTTEERRQELRSFIEYAKDHDVRFMTVSEFVDAHREGRLTRTERGWAYEPPGNGTSGGNSASD